MSWAERAACIGLDPALFFPDTKELQAGGIPGFHRQLREAIAVCRSCPVRLECAAEAKAHRESWGVWGGKYMRGRGR